MAPTLDAIIGFGLLALALGMGIAASVTCVRNTRGPKERAYVLSHCVGAWSVIVLLFLLMAVVPSPYRYFLLVPYFVHLPIATYRFTLRQQIIRHREEQDAERHPARIETPQAADAKA